MPSIRLVSWNEDDALRRAGELKRAGVEVDSRQLNPSGLVSALANFSAVCIDLDRLPANGRELATAMRQTKALRHIPIIFAGGPKDKVPQIKKALPDAIYADWEHAAGTIRKALKLRPPANPVRPPAHMERYAGRTLAQKLGITPETTVAFYGAPDGFAEQFGDLREAAQPKLIFWFARSRAELEREVEFMAARLVPGAAIWIIYPKQAGRIKADFTQNDMRATALAAGLVDYKICAVDEDWSGLKFALKKGARSTGRSPSLPAPASETHIKIKKS